MATNVPYTIKNVSGGSLAYQGQTIVNGGSYTPSTSTQAQFAADPGLIADVLANKVIISIGTYEWSGAVAVEVLRTAALSRSEVLSPLPGFIARANSVVAAGATVLKTYTMVNDIALIDFHFGGRGIGQASLLRYNESAIELAPGGGFNSEADVALWTNAGLGDSSALVWSYATDQFFAGTGSAKTTFTKSDAADRVGFKYTYSTPKDVSAWRYISSNVRVTVAAGGNTARTVSMILTDVGGATRTWQIAGSTTTAPFNTEQWHTILGEIENPTASTGTFDPYNVASIELRLQDGADRAGSIWWDNVRFLTSQTLIERIYTKAEETFQLILNPVELFNTGEIIGLQYKNNDATSKEFTVTAKGVLR